ncbi:hypothetical protein EDD28_1853 [Salana multivorans]|uniref:Membrane protein YmcC n=1 Tax=Salana multivorans TaxID=120377 RepID=A0A3N2DBV0_9MICO|nr:hypothetical protein [Salana multivorans]OJX97684.1 MAG: hypothetical protein BGO96_12080 [Micrococcales bacterium 73-15]ROR97256.1 hypothetical protein EDD28_1853 [Salana multivorans]
MILALIVACEVGFWVAILSGLAVRYLLRRPRLGAGLLIAAPVIDVVLLVLVAIDLLRGGTASWEHGLAAIYIGFSVAFGHPIIAWADVRFAHRFAGGPRPEQLTGTSYTVKCWKDVLRSLLMAAVAGAIAGGLILLVGDPARTGALAATFRILGLILTIDLLWAISYTIWPRREVTASRGASVG